MPADGRLDLTRCLTLTLLMWRIRWAPNNASRWQIGFNSVFNKTWACSRDFSKIVKYKISLKSVQREPSCSVRTDRQTDVAKLLFAFRNMANSSNETAHSYTRQAVVFRNYVIRVWCKILFIFCTEISHAQESKIHLRVLSHGPQPVNHTSPG